MIGMYVRSIRELSDAKMEFLSRYGKYVESMDVVLLSEGHTSQRKYLFPAQQNPPAAVKDFMGGNSEAGQAERIDDKEKAILRIIGNDGRYSYVDLYKKTGMDVKTIRSRIKTLEERGIIRGYVTFLDVNRLGYQFFKICIYLKSHEDSQKIVHFGIAHPNVIHVIETVGSWDIEFEAETKSLSQLFEIESELKNQFPRSIRKTNTTIIAEEMKLDFMPCL